MNEIIKISKVRNFAKIRKFLKELGIFEKLASLKPLFVLKSQLSRFYYPTWITRQVKQDSSRPVRASAVKISATGIKTICQQSTEKFGEKTWREIQIREYLWHLAKKLKKWINVKIDIFDGINCQKFNKTTLIRNRLGVNEHVVNSSIYETKQRKRKLFDVKHLTLTEFWSGTNPKCVEFFTNLRSAKRENED